MKKIFMTVLYNDTHDHNKSTVNPLSSTGATQVTCYEDHCVQTLGLETYSR